MDSAIRNCLLACSWLWLATGALAYETPTNVPLKQVFLMESESRDAAPFNSVRVALLPALRNRMIEDLPGECTLMNLNDVRYTVFKDEKGLATGLKKQVSGRGFDLAIAVGDASSRVMAKIRDEAFPGVPVLMVACDPPVEGTTPNTVVMARRGSPAAAIENILHVLPETTNIVVVLGDSPRERKLAVVYGQAFAAFTNRVSFQWLNKMRFERVKSACSRLPPHTAIFFGSLISDFSNMEYDYNFALQQLCAVAKAPVFVLYESQFGEGVVGGPLVPDTTIGKVAAEVAFRLLSGERPGDIVQPTFAAGPPVYDGRELRRWNIDERLLAPDSRVVSRPPTAWQQYRAQIVATLVVFALLLLLVVALLVNRQRLRRTETGLRVSQQRASMAARAAKLGFWARDLPENTIWISASCRTLFGFTADEEIRFESILARVHPEDRASQRDAIERAFNGGADYTVEHRIVLPGGGIRWISTRGVLEYDEGGRPVRLCGISMDITERRQAEESSRNAHDLMSAVFHSVPGLLYLYTEDGRLVRWNTQHEVMTGYTSAELLNFRAEDWFDPAEWAEVAKVVARVYSEGYAQAEMTMKLKNGQRLPIFANGSRVMIDGKPHMVGIAIDMSERKRAEMELAQQRDELAHLSRVTTVSALSGSLAHELNQPLGIILSNAQAAQELLTQDPPALTDMGEILSDIVAADRRAAEIIQRLRALLKRGETTMLPLPLNELLEEVLYLTRSDLIGRGVLVVCDLARELPRITGDRVQIQQVALNLILNAADAVAGNAPGARRIHLATARHDDVVRVTVRDEGIGLPADTARLFQPFFTTKTQGLGMGLAICRTIVNAHHGRIWAEAHPERGALFHFELALAVSGEEP